MRHVDHHAELFHQRHRLDTESGETAERVGLADAVGHHRATVPGQRGDPDAEAPKRLDEGERRADRLGSFEGQHEGNATAADDSAQIGGRLDDRHVGRVPVGDPARRLDDLEGPGQCAGADELLLGEQRQHLQHDAAGAQLRKPDVTERVGVAALAAVLDGQQQVVVSVGDRDHNDGYSASGPAALTTTRQPPPGTYVIGISDTVVMRT